MIEGSFVADNIKGVGAYVNLLFARYALWIRAGNTWPFSRLKLSCGPNTFVGITEVNIVPYFSE